MLLLVILDRRVKQKEQDKKGGRETGHSKSSHKAARASDEIWSENQRACGYLYSSRRQMVISISASFSIPSSPPHDDATGFV